MILPAARLWYEGKTRDLEEVLKEAEDFKLNGYARCAFQGSAQYFIVLEGGAVKETVEIGPGNRPVPKSPRDLWGKSKIKSGLLQVFEIPPEAGFFLTRLSGRRLVLGSGEGLHQLKEMVLRQRLEPSPAVMDVETPEGKALLAFERKAIVACWFTEAEGFTLSGLEAFKRLAAVVVKGQTYQLHLSGLGDPAKGGTPWLPMLLEGAAHDGAVGNLQAKLVEKYGRYYGPGTVLFREGETGEDFILIVSGRVAVYKERAARRKILAELGPGEFLGEMAIFNNAPRTATAETVENSLLIRIGKDQLRTLLFNSYEFRINMVKRLSRRLKDTVEEMVRLWEDPRAVYLEKVIFQIINSDQKWQEEGIPPGLLMQEISGHSGMRFSEIDAVFRKFLETGKIEFIRGKVVMKEPSSLP